VTAARLEVNFYLSQNPGAITDIGVYEVYQPWVENEVTWNQSADGYPWNGCDGPSERSQLAVAVKTVESLTGRPGKAKP